MNRPNILWISFEDSTPRFGCYGDKIARTPNVDRLAAEGCRFPNAFCTAGVCAPSRAAIITGMYQTFIGAQHMRTQHTMPHTPNPVTSYATVPPPYVKCFTEYLRAAGYYCTNNGKTDYQFDSGWMRAPFTAWDVQRELPLDQPDLLAIHWRNRPRPDQPFFAVFNLMRTHESQQWPKPGETLQTDPAAVTVPPYLPDTLEVRKTIARQYDNIAFNDTQVGTLLQQLEEDGLAADTIVFLWSDHGEGLPRSKRWPYDTGIRIPLIVRWPGQLQPGSVDERLVSLIDLGPTVLSLCGVPRPYHLQGQPFLGPEAQPREYVFATRDRYDESYDLVRAVRDRRYKYIRHYYPQLEYSMWVPYRNRHPAMQELWRLYAEGKLTEPQQFLMQTHRPPEELYDTATDPWELRNLAADPAQRATLDRLRAVLDAWQAKYDPWRDIPETEMLERMWPGRKQPLTDMPCFVPLGPGQPGTELMNEGGRLRGPVLMQLTCATQGASIGYTLQTGKDVRWELYAGPFRLPPGTTTLRAKAIRYGYKESAERVATFIVS